MAAIRLMKRILRNQMTLYALAFLISPYLSILIESIIEALIRDHQERRPIAKTVGKFGGIAGNASQPRFRGEHRRHFYFSSQTKRSSPRWKR